ncbi:MAG: PIN domain-containing protein [Pseudonocardiaceae bacterium]
MTAPRSFVDTNVFVYAADESPEEQNKHKVASALLATDPDALVISTQVLQEFYVTVTRKLRIPLPEERAASAVRGIAKLEVVQVDVPLVLAAVDTSRVVKISLWDALVIEAARQAGCQRILTEDLSHGQVIRGVAVENPFLANHPPPDQTPKRLPGPTT